MRREGHEAPVAGPRTHASGVLAGLGAYLWWGVVVLFWPLLDHVAALEVMAYRVVWALAVVLLCLVVFRVPWNWLAVARSEAPRLVPAAFLVGANWLTYIWAVNSGHVAEASLGYFLNPLVNVAVGMVVLRERPGRAAVTGVLAAAAGVVVITTVMAATVWIALLLAFSFSAYGLVKRGVTIGPLPGLAVETAVLTPLAVGYLLVAGSGAFASDVATSLLLVASGVVTVVPLYLFAIAAPRLNFGLLGMLQYIAPTTMLLIGVTYLGQYVPGLYWVGLALVWVGFACYMVGAARLRHARLVTAREPGGHA